MIGGCCSSHSTASVMICSTPHWLVEFEIRVVLSSFPTLFQRCEWDYPLFELYLLACFLHWTLNSVNRDASQSNSVNVRDTISWRSMINCGFPGSTLAQIRIGEIVVVRQRRQVAVRCFSRILHHCPKHFSESDYYSECSQSRPPTTWASCPGCERRIFYFVKIIFNRNPILASITVRAKRLMGGPPLTARFHGLISLESS